MNAGGVPNTCKSSGKVLHPLFDPSKSMQIDTGRNGSLWLERIVEY